MSCGPASAAIDRLALVRRDRTDAATPAAGRTRARPCVGPALFVEERDQRLADAELGDRLFGVDLRDWRASSRAAALTAFWSRGVNARSACWTRLPSWPSTVSGTSSGFCVTKIHADALGADEPHDLLDLVQQRLRRVGEQQVRLVEEEHELRLVRIADFGQSLVELGQQPEQQRRVELRRLHQLVGGEDVDDAAAARRSAAGRRC